jgi:hypothetical protein
MSNLINPYFEKLKETFYDDLIKVKNPTILELYDYIQKLLLK